MADILASIGIGAMAMCIISAPVITLSIWSQNEDNHKEETKANSAQIVVYVILEKYLKLILKILIVIQWIIYTGVNSRLLYKWVSIIIRLGIQNKN